MIDEVLMFVAGPLAGWLSDRKGTGLITIVCLLLSIPWFIVMAIHGPLALLIMGVVVSSKHLSHPSLYIYSNTTYQTSSSQQSLPH
jgi:MFS family permease